MNTPENNDTDKTPLDANAPSGLDTATCSPPSNYWDRYQRRVRIGMRWNYRPRQMFSYPLKLWECKGDAMSIIIDAIGLLFVFISSPLLIPITILMRLFEPFFVRDQPDEILDKVESRLDARRF